MSYRDRIKELREFRKLNQKEFAKLLGVTPSTITNYENGHSAPDYDKLIKMTSILGCDLNYLFQDDIDVDPITFTTSQKEQEVIRQLRALSPVTRAGIEKLINYHYQQKISFDDNKFDRVIKLPELASTAYPENYELYAMIGDSMLPMFKDGDVLIVEPTDALAEDELGVFEHKGRVIVRRYFKDRLEPLNPAMEDIKLNRRGVMRIIGRVRGKV